MPKILDNMAQKLAAEARRQALEVGYDALNIRAVAKNCGIGVGTVYNYYHSRDDLVAAFLLEDWMACLERIRKETGSGQIRQVLTAVYRELSAFMDAYRELFLSASATVPSPPRKYHAILRSQISGILRPMCPDDFTADFAAEAMVTWTVEGRSCDELLHIIEKIM